MVLKGLLSFPLSGYQISGLLNHFFKLGAQHVHLTCGRCGRDDALSIREAGKLGGILMQFPSYVTLKPASLEYLEWAKERLGGDEMMVEFRHRSWLEPANADRTLSFLRSLGANSDGIGLDEIVKGMGQNVFYAPTVNSYKRFRTGSWAPTRLAWSHDNRTASFRVVGKLSIRSRHR